MIHHLITNALEAISGKSGPWIRLDIFETDGVVSLRVADSGTGIPASIEKKIMQPFFTTKDFGKGTGLGLSVCRGIIGEHKGELVYELYEGHTSFVIKLPATDKP